MNYTAIDIETATPNLWSICQIGIVKVENFEIIETKLINIKPPENTYSYYNSLIHGMNCKDTECELCFNEHWNDINQFLEGQLVIAHNVSFDINSIHQALEYYKLPRPQFNTFCTYKATGHRLIDICNSYGIDIVHHNALSDAIACAKIYHLICKGEFDSSKVYRSENNDYKYSNHEKISSQFLKPNFEVQDIENPFFKKKVVITGVYKNLSRNAIAEILKNKGADIDTSVTPKTSFLISGNEPGPSKIKKAIEFNVTVISEEEFYSMIN
ncbi:MAG TPA: exonuclease domain-containing protein [Bacteroidales bacterium]|nr:exonuclease domain-containing protein [Bacteroidales bacterium]